MADEINTHYIKSGFASADDIILCQTATTRTIFRPALHVKGVRGEIIRQKIGKDGVWKDTNEVDFRRLPADTGVSVELDTAGTKTLFEKLGKLYEVSGHGVGFGDHKYVVADENEILLIDDASKKKAFQEILDKDYSEDFWKQLVDQNPDLAARLAVAQVQVDRQTTIQEFEASMVSHAGEEGYWQQFFQDNPWILDAAFSASVFMINGETYLGGKLPSGRNGVGGVATDYLFGDESTKSFAVIDIKTPGAHLVGPLYRGNQGSGHASETYSMHVELTGGVVQVRNQITVAVEHFQSVLGAAYQDKINRVHPRGVLVAGTLEKLSQRQKDSLNQFRQGLYSLTVITFDELLNRLKKLYDMDYANTDTIVADEPESSDASF